MNSMFSENSVRVQADSSTEMAEVEARYSQEEKEIYTVLMTGFVVDPEVRQIDSSSSILLSQDCLAIQVFLGFHTNYKIICSRSATNTIDSLIGIALNLWIALGSIFIFTILILPIHEHHIFLHLFVSSLISFISVL